ncbi:MAG: hypothetical protein A3B99_00285 [Candidatus Yanofskybacteria bacterium RIFCSPHIGHO2_02_FULL_44_12b]|uniref:Uncharacterized protein n=2 Tax=Candidatus Yanofskyibacteriota TaxID=1752733 RepID=A0A1F8GKJ1_9BACT|nr:MAG: hypothetical protein UW79_C0006G0023 [Candidatus Yanofskybacteria bacterium GW2011_GWA2_44_9]OGN14783.1 MAG: hypothetical protein A3B99_00285 [Candidatus Yanofskybacteria bacterium RIFCSPHIGHO2_02_FULL_44_12b]OGN25915.1 MAG: hypothetical protein A2925_02650 [Candidatus Yanofskybacteria bacterium RIFCSPLOWO2_01_FULL_44_22]
MRKSIFLASIPFVLLISSGCGVKPAEKASFEGVSTYLWGERPTAYFRNVCFPLGQTSCYFKSVHTSLVNLKIEIDESLSGTAISVKPAWPDRYFDPFSVTTPNVVVYAQSKEDANHWNAWQASEIAKLVKELQSRRQLRRVLPDVR